MCSEPHCGCCWCSESRERKIPCTSQSNTHSFLRQYNTFAFSCELVTPLHIWYWSTSYTSAAVSDATRQSFNTCLMLLKHKNYLVVLRIRMFRVTITMSLKRLKDKAVHLPLLHVWSFSLFILHQKPVASYTPADFGKSFCRDCLEKGRHFQKKNQTLGSW